MVIIGIIIFSGYILLMSKYLHCLNIDNNNNNNIISNINNNNNNRQIPPKYEDIENLNPPNYEE